MSAFVGLWPPLLFSTFLGNVITMLLANKAVQMIKVSEAGTAHCGKLWGALTEMGCGGLSPIQVSLIAASAAASVLTAADSTAYDVQSQMSTKHNMTS